MDETMRAMAATPDGVEMVRVPVPTPGKGEVRVKVISSAVNAGEEKVIAGALIGRFLHAKTSPLILGWDVAGTIDALGEGVTDIGEGDAVWGHLAYAPNQKQGAFAEYVTMPASSVAAKPDDVPFHVVSAAATVTMTGLQAMRDDGRLGDGGQALIIGAGGGIGAGAVGIAKRLGAHVTGVCSTRDIERVKALGADVVIDRKVSNPLDASAAYDVVFDTPAVHSYGQCVGVLRPGGTYVTTLPNLGLVTGIARALVSSKRCKFVQVDSKRADLDLVGRWLSDGLDVPIDSRYAIADLAGALSRQTERDRSGRVVVDVADGWPA